MSVDFSPPHFTFYFFQVRNGPGLFENGDRTFLHTFDGFAKLASWHFPGNGSCIFSTRFIQSGFYMDSMESNIIAPYLLFETVSPPFGFFDRLKCLARGIDNMNVNVYEFTNPKSMKKEYAALSDFWVIYKINIQNLSTEAKIKPTVNYRHQNRYWNERKSYNSFSRRKWSRGRQRRNQHRMRRQRQWEIERRRRRYEMPSRDVSTSSLSFLSLMSSAHPLPEYGTSNRFTYLASVAVLPWQSNMISLIRMESLKRRTIVAQWSVDRVPYMHSFSVTKTRVVLLACPFFVNVMCMVRTAEPFSCLDWKQNEPSTLYVVSLKDGTVDTIRIPNVFTMHHVNAYDVEDGYGYDSDGYDEYDDKGKEDIINYKYHNYATIPQRLKHNDRHGQKNKNKTNNIVVDISSYPNPNFVKNLQLKIVKDHVKRNQFKVHARLKRIHIDMTKKNASVNDIDLGPPPSISSYLDMPVINEKYRSHRYCYVYGIVLKTDNVTLSKIAIVKKDVCHTGSENRDEVWHVPGEYPSEPWFVERPGAVSEDDGILFVPVIKGFENSTYLVMLNAKDMTVISEAKVPTNIPYSLHGRFFPS